MDHGEGDRGSTPSHGEVHKDGLEGNGCAAHQAPGGPPTNSSQPGIVPGPPTGAHPDRHHQQYRDGSGGENIMRGRAGRDGLHQISTLASTFWGGKWGTAADCCRFHGMVEKWAAPMGRLSSHDERPADRTGQVARGQTSQGRRNLDITDGQVPTSGDGAGGKCRLWDQTTDWWHGGWDRGWHSRHARSLVGAFTGRGLGVSPN